MASKIRVSPEVARLVAPDAPRDRKLEAARGGAGLSGRNLLTALYFFSHGADPEIRTQALHALRTLSGEALVAAVTDPELPPPLLHLLAQVRLQDSQVIRAILPHPALEEQTWTLLAGRSSGEVLKLFLLAVRQWQGYPAVVAALLGNARLDPALKTRIEGMIPPVPPTVPAAPVASPEPSPPPPGADEVQEVEESSPAEGDREAGTGESEEELNASKYQMALEMGVSEKIKMALTGDKEWRGIFLKDPNKLVHGAAIKNPRITDGEVLMIAKNKASSEELIRAILLNKEWVKNPLIRAALVTHPKTPAPQALRFMPSLSIKELKVLSKSKGVSQVLTNAARRMVAEKDKQK